MEPTAPHRDTNRPVGRPRGFDEDVALAAALDLFWRQGFEATSLDDLTRATGLNRSSFYGCFGSKRGVLLRALTRYADNALSTLAERAAEHPDPRAALKAMVAAIADPKGGPRGCLMVNCITELAPQDAEIAALGRRHIERIAAAFVSLMPEIPPDEAADRAQALIALAVGAITLRKAGLPTPRIESVLARTDSLLPPQP
jgi:TetR/AcrR family transcriptional repressor of nem operon